MLNPIMGIIDRKEGCFCLLKELILLETRYCKICKNGRDFKTCKK